MQSKKQIYKAIIFLFLLKCVSAYPQAKTNIAGGWVDSLGRKQGLWLIVTENNLPYSQINYKDDKKNGDFITYSNGNISTKGSYINDSLNGFYWLYYSNGQINSVEEYKNGKLNGKSIDYYDNGNIGGIGTFINGSINGVYVEFDEHGDTTNIRHYEMGKCLDCSDDDYAFKYFGKGELYEIKDIYKKKTLIVSTMLNHEELRRKIYRITKKGNIIKSEGFYENDKVIKCIYYNRKGEQIKVVNY